MLYAGKPQQAFECLIVAVRRYHRNSRLWLRLAECCITSHRGSNEIDFDIKQKKKEFVIECIGSNENQKIILTTNLSKDKKYRYVLNNFWVLFQFRIKIIPAQKANRMPCPFQR